MSSSPVLAHFSLSSPTRVVTDASPWAVDAILLQQQSDMSYRPVAYASRSLTATEMKYAQIEREALAIVFGCEHFHTYLFGRSFELETDHRPLEYLFQPKFTHQASRLLPELNVGFYAFKSTILQLFIDLERKIWQTPYPGCHYQLQHAATWNPALTDMYTTWYNK